MKNKTKKIIRITCAILLIVLVQTIGITYAKYITSEKVTGQAEIAQWSFKITKDGTQIKTINLADTVPNTVEANEKIAPGSWGAIVIDIDVSGSDIGADYTVEFANEQNKPTNIEFVYNNVTYKSLSEIKISGNIEKNAQPKPISILWRWNYETGKTDEEKAANNIIDTEYANTNTKYTFDIIATGTQSR